MSHNYREDLLFWDDLDEFNRAMAKWLAFYNTERPHHALGLKPPTQMLFTDHPKRQMLWTSTNGCKKVNLCDNRSGFEKDGIFYEYKASGYNQDGAINIVQIRLWQKCNYVIQSISDDNIATFLLSHEEMEAETVLLNASSARGTKQGLKRNKRNELRMTLFPGSEDWSRRVEQYKNREFFKE